VTSKRRNYVLLLAGVLAMCALVGALGHSHEPSYQDHTLTEWLDEYYSDSREDLANDAPHTKAYVALRAIGTNALPTLLHWVAHAPARRHQRLTLLVSHLPRAVADNRLVQRLLEPGRRPYFWHQGFLVLGPEANGAVPELTQLMYAPNAQYNGFWAALALAYIGPAGLAPLQSAALDPHARCRLAAIQALGAMGANAKPALPALTQLLNDPAPDVRMAVTNALVEIAPDVFTQPSAR